MLFKKTLIMSNIVNEIIKNIIQSTLINILMNKILPLILILLKYLSIGSYYLIFIYMIAAVSIIFIIYKIYNYFKLSSNNFSTYQLSSILSDSYTNSDSDDFNLDPKKMEKLKNTKKKLKKKKSTSINILTTDLLTF
jgi:hypothetical protein